MQINALFFLGGGGTQIAHATNEPTHFISVCTIFEWLRSNQIMKQSIVFIKPTSTQPVSEIFFAEITFQFIVSGA